MHEDHPEYLFQKYFHQALQKERDGAYEEALIDINACIILFPNKVDAFYLRGKIYAALDKLAAALEDVTHVLANNPYFERALFLRAGILQKLERYEQAIEDWHSYEKLQPDNVQVQFHLYDCYHALKIEDKASHHFFCGYMRLAEDAYRTGDLAYMHTCLTKAATGCWDKTRYHRLLANYYRQIKEPDKALNSLATIIKTGHYELEDVINRAEVLIELNQVDEALLDYALVLTQAPEQPDALRGMAMLYYAQKRYDKAISYLNKLCEAPEFDIHARIMLYRTYEAYVQQLLKHRPTAIQEIAGCYLHLGDGARCLQVLVENQNALSETAFLSLKARACLLSGQTEAAISILHQLVESSNACLEDFVILGRIYLKKKEYSCVINTLENAQTTLHLSSDFDQLAYENILEYLEVQFNKKHAPESQYYFILGEAYLEAKPYQKSIENFTIALTYDASNCEILLQRGRAYAKSGMAEKAMEDYSSARESGATPGQVLLQETWVRYTLKEYDQCQVAIKELESYFQHSADLMYLAGQIYHDSGEYQQAAFYYTKAIEYNIPHLYVWRNRAKVKEFLKDYESGYHDIQKFISFFSPGDAEYSGGLRDKAYILYHWGKREEAKLVLEELLPLPERNDSDLQLMGLILMEQELYEEAIHYYTQSLQINPHNSRSLAQMGACLLELERFKEAQQFYIDAAALGFNAASNYMNAAYTAVLLDEYQKVVDIIMLVHELQDLDYWCLQVLGDAYFNLKKYELALVQYNQLHQLLETDTDKEKLREIYVAQARCYLASQQPGKAHECLLLANGIGHYIDHYSLLTDALEAEGKYVDAYACYQYYVSFNPDDTTAKEKLMKLGELANTYCYKINV